ncbi:hypothetical protein QBC44DRAFT_332213 [Cladorrhinum sp. PSN332]|nr:hypothetical protein QBC44DRAFT_332213 [Cladorrhinum sp. PSN332]
MDDRIYTKLSPAARKYLQSLDSFKDRKTLQSKCWKHNFNFAQAEEFKFYILFSGGCTKAEVLEAFDRAKVDRPWIHSIRQFLQNHVADGYSYPRDGKFPEDKIMYTNPALDLIGYLMRTPRTEHTIENLARGCCRTFIQIALDHEMMDMGLKAFEHEWDFQFGKPTSVKDKSFRGLYFLHHAQDRYALVYPNGDQAPFKADMHEYDEQDILGWMYRVESEVCKVEKFGFDSSNKPVAGPRLLKRWDIGEAYLR